MADDVSEDVFSAVDGAISGGRKDTKPPPPTGPTAPTLLILLLLPPTAVAPLLLATIVPVALPFTLSHRNEVVDADEPPPFAASSREYPPLPPAPGTEDCRVKMLLPPTTPLAPLLLPPLLLLPALQSISTTSHE
uniref:Uncharacterized protein n=1 Tax=Anopheles atroparvus TaxID=41427 RepID=A0A182IN22_ANOAO